MSDFLTVEDINSVVAEYYNTPFWDTITIDTGNNVDFTDIKFDYLTVDRTYSGGEYTFTIVAENDILGMQCYFHDANGNYIPSSDIDTSTNYTIVVTASTPSITCFFYCDIQNGEIVKFKVMDWVIKSVTPTFTKGMDTFEEMVITLEAVNPDFSLEGDLEFYQSWNSGFPGSITVTDGVLTLQQIPKSYGLWRGGIDTSNAGYNIFPKAYARKLCVMPCFDNLIVGKINHLVVVMENATNVSGVPYSPLDFKCSYPVSNIDYYYVDSINNYSYISFDLDLRNVSELVKVPLTITLGAGDYCDESFVFDTVYPTITTFEELSSLFVDGGTGRLGSNLTLTGDLTLSNDVYLIGNDKTLTFASHKIIVPTGKTLKIEDTIITGGVNTIQQFNESIVELTGCSFTDCISPNGVGGVIDCDVNLHSLDNPTDFQTTITDCTFTNCDCPILHGGELNVLNSEVNGKLSNYNFPYFLYQTDGTANLTGNTFQITSNSTINEDIKFNSCIFTCGENAIVNGFNHDGLTRNDVTDFIRNNSSIINLTYYYDLIEANVTLQSNRGYCHSTSGNDYVFKTNVTPQRSG